MLGGMDVPAVAAGPWIALGAALGMLLLLAAGAVALWLRSPVPPPGTAEVVVPGQPRDDLADFLARPPGTPGAPEVPDEGWAVLAPVAPAREAAPATPGGRPGTALAALAVVALLLVGVAAALAAAARSPEPASVAAPAEEPADPPAASGDEEVAFGDEEVAFGDEEVTVRLSFGGVVLEEHAVGVTVGYPELELTSDDGRTVARLRLPAANCLAATAPPRPGDPGCREARTEYAELASPDLDVVRDGDELTVSGRFATELHPPGGAAEPTGRSYDVSVTLGAPGDGGSEPELTWGDRLVPTR
ncbi:hypothetical protein SAMN05660485_00361 [Blastococcus fimeti]|nr:hypothetical protein SAMN05660485_00361 [Blastococcus fimeti]